MKHQCVRRDAASFLTRAQNWLMQNEAEYNLMLGIAAFLKASANNTAYLATVEHAGDLVGCAFRTPPYKLGVTRMPQDAAAVLADDVVQVYDDIPAVLGTEAVASAVASGIAQHYGKSTTQGRLHRIYELTTVREPAVMPDGNMRLATTDDLEVLVDWMEAFARETEPGRPDARAYAQMQIRNQGAFVWDDDGIKSLAVWAGFTPNGVRFGYVYTPPELRGRGYASACVATASQRALDKGYKFCCLYTDLDNATSNDIYQKIGYQPVCDVVDYNIV